MSHKNTIDKFTQERVDLLRDAVHENWFAYALLVPTIVFLFIVLWIPFLRGITLSFFNWSIGEDIAYVGLDNYLRLASWEVFHISVKVTFMYVTVTFAQVGLGLLAALLVANMDYFKNVTSGLFLTAYTMPGVVTGTIWVFLLSPTLGPVFDFLVDQGLLNDPIYWTTNGDSAFAVIWLIGAWTFWPFAFLILVASREAIPRSYYESAQIYGANRFQQFFHVTLPQMSSALIIVLSLRFVWNLAKISQPLTLTGGGPGWDTSLMAILMFRLAWTRGEMGIAFAVGLILFIVAVLPIIVFIKGTREQERVA